MSTARGDALPYSVLIIDDEEDMSGWGEGAKAALELEEFVVTHVVSWDHAKAMLQKQSFDIIVIDLELRGSEDGIDVMGAMRKADPRQTIILVTGNDAYLNLPIKEYGDALTSGPVSFYSKVDSKRPFVEVAREASTRVDPIRRALLLMQSAGMGSIEYEINGDLLTIDQIMRSARATTQLERTLRESLNALLLELAAKPRTKK